MQERLVGATLRPLDTVPYRSHFAGMARSYSDRTNRGESLSGHLSSG
jgi:hypothetical protein